MTERGGSFISRLFAKLASVKQIQNETGRSTRAAQREVERQIEQALMDGDPIKGTGVTKSGKED